MRLHETGLELSLDCNSGSLLSSISSNDQIRRLEPSVPIRFVVTDNNRNRLRCEIGLLSELPDSYSPKLDDSIFRLKKRPFCSADTFNVVLLVPTGIGCDIGGHAGDAGPVARLLASSCDRLITHPNVVNASDINEMSSNTLYVEGSILTRFLMGTIGLRPVRSNRVLVIVDGQHASDVWSAAVNAVNAGRAAGGFALSHIETLVSQLRVSTQFMATGRATGTVENLDGICDIVSEYLGQIDAVALTTTIDVPLEVQQNYFNAEGTAVNPYGGIESLLTHGVSSIFGLPSAHSPMALSLPTFHESGGIFDPRMAAEAVSMTFLHCILKGLHASPQIVTDESCFGRAGVLSAADVSCVVIPDGCLGLPTLAALEQGIPVIAVRENRNVMKNDLRKLQWAPGQLHVVNNYLEAAGVLSALRAGIPPEFVRRPSQSVRFGPRSRRYLEGKALDEYSAALFASSARSF